MSEIAEDLRPGSVFGPYQVIAEVGQGGMGQVLRARHTTLQRDVALKVLAPHIANETSFAERFLREARAAARLNHPNIVQVYDFGVVAGRFYLAMEFVEGRTLLAILLEQGPLGEENVRNIGCQACSALVVAHEAGLVHRDLKPENLMLTPRGALKIVDLGLARMSGDDGMQTATGFTAGTPHYMPPEQIEAEKDIDGRADVYALAATLFHLASGKVPFPGPTGAVIMSRHLREDPPDVRVFAPHLSAGFSAALLKGMARWREYRTPSALALWSELAASARPAMLPEPQGSLPPPAIQSAAPSATFARSPTPGPSTTPAPHGHTTPIPGWDAGLLQNLELELTPLVGPMARVLVRRAAKQVQDLSGLRRRLALEIPGEAERQAFLASGGPLSTPSSPSSLSQLMTSLPVSSGLHLDGDPRLPAAEQILTGEIGPLARVLVRRVAKRASSWEAFIEEVCAEVPDPLRQNAVRSGLLRLQSW